MKSLEERSKEEIRQGRELAESGEAERVWNWSTPAGVIRARRRAQLICDAAKLKPGMRVLEVGCGTGLFTELFADYGAHITAIDISPDLIRLARERKLDPSLVEFHEIPIEDEKLKGPFDAAVGSSVLHHLEMPLALQRVFQLLKPGGVLVFAEPNMLNPQIWAERNLPAIRRRAHVTPGETAIIRFRLARELADIGFTEIEIVNVDWLHPLTPRPLITFVQKVESIFERLPGIREFSGSVLIHARRPDRS